MSPAASYQPEIRLVMGLHTRAPRGAHVCAQVSAGTVPLVRRVLDAMFKFQDYLILGAAFLSFLVSVSIWFGAAGPPHRDAGAFVGLWVPSILALGIYVKLCAERR